MGIIRDKPQNAGSAVDITCGGLMHESGVVCTRDRRLNHAEVGGIHRSCEVHGGELVPVRDGNF